MNWKPGFICVTMSSTAIRVSSVLKYGVDGLKLAVSVGGSGLGSPTQPSET